MNKKIMYILALSIFVILVVIFYMFKNRQEEEQREPLSTKSEQKEIVDMDARQDSEIKECEDIGQECEGGIIAYIDEEGKKLIVSDMDNATDIQWGCRGQLLDIKDTGYGTGSTNTQAILSWHEGWEDPWFTAPSIVTGYCHEKNDGTVAARVCDELDLNGYGDWYLPSIDELDLIYENVYKNKQGGFELKEYWSSSEFSEGSAWIKSFLTRGDEYGYQKTFARGVRCVRSS